MSDFPTHLSVDDARRRIIDRCALRQLPIESVPLQAAHGRIIYNDVIAPRDLPPFVNSAMDGFALRSIDLPDVGERRLRIAGTCLAGDSGVVSIGAGECVRITTGAPMPIGADSVVIKERVDDEGVSIVVRAGEHAGANVRPAGEDIRAGEVVMRQGQRIRATRIGALASVGLSRIEACARPKVAIFTTGDELVMPGTECARAQIHNSNGFSLAAMLDSCGIASEIVSDPGSDMPFRHLRDDRELIRTALLDAADAVDVIVTSGGVSAGEADFLPGLVAELGRIHFWKVRMRPGMPMLFGEIGKALIFCLPGNPVSTIATFLCLVQPALAALQGGDNTAPPNSYARLSQAIEKHHDRTEFMRAVCESREDGTLWVTSMKAQGSAMLRGLIDADSLIVVPENSRRIAAGEVVKIIPLPDIS